MPAAITVRFTVAAFAAAAAPAVSPFVPALVAVAPQMVLVPPIAPVSGAAAAMAVPGPALVAAAATPEIAGVMAVLKMPVLVAMSSVATMTVRTRSGRQELADGASQGGGHVLGLGRHDLTALWTLVWCESVNESARALG